MSRIILPPIERLRKENKALRLYVQRAMFEAGAVVLETRQLAWEQADEINRLRDELRECQEYKAMYEGLCK